MVAPFLTSCRFDIGMNSKKKKLIIEAGRTEKHYWLDLWRYRELFIFLSWRDILVRYKQTAIGVAWAVLRPFLVMVVFTFVFGKLAGLPSDGVPYPVLVFVAMLPWQLFSNSLSESSSSLVGNANLISKVYFPRLIIPASALATGLVDFFVSFILLLALMFWYQFSPDWKVVALPFLVILSLAASFGFGLWFTALNVKYRDFRYIVPFIVQFGLYVSPVGFSSTVVPEKWRLIYSLNPMVGVIDGFRWALLGDTHVFYGAGFVASLLVVCFVFFSGVWYFRRTEKTFADII